MAFFQDLLINEKVIFCAYIALGGLIFIGLALFGALCSKISSGKFVKSCKTISDFANESGVINDGNLEQFEATCLDDKTNPVFLEGWDAFKSARFGYPSEYIEKEKTLEKFCARKFKTAVAIYTIVLLLLAVAAAVYTIITSKGNQYSLIYAVCGIIAPLILLAAYLPCKPYKKADAAFTQTLEDIDTAVQLQHYVQRKVDNARINEAESVIRDVILFEQSKPIPSKKDQIDKPVDADIRAELFEEDVDPAFSVAYNPPVEEPAEYIAAETAEPLPEPEPMPAPKKQIKFEPFVSVLNQAIDGGYGKATLRKLANIIVLAFAKFTESEQREVLKNSIRRFIVSYKAAVAAEREAEEAAAREAEEAAAAEYAAQEAGTPYDFTDEGMIYED